MKKGTFFILIIILVFSYLFQKEITHYIAVNYIYKYQINERNPNKYKLNYNFFYLNETTDFIPKNKTDLKNILFTILNNGYDEFGFYCDFSYKDCIMDIQNISNDNEFLSSLNNFVHPFNIFDTIYINYNDLGKINIEFDKLYKPNEINTLNIIVDELYNKLITNDMSLKEKIKVIHDYIINKTTYDSEHALSILSSNKDYVPLYQSHKAVGPLLQQKAICGGYSDAMALFLNKMKIPNLRISNEKHIWNLVKLDNNWYHLDLTWDDPVADEDMIIYEYFLITNEQIKKINNNHHFDTSIYREGS